MGNKIKLFLAVISVFVFTGCGQKVQFNKNYVQSDLKTDLKKVTS